MLNVILSPQMDLVSRWVENGDTLKQYSIIPVNLYIKKQPGDREFTMTFVRPDGYKSSDRGLSYQGQEEVKGEFYHKYVSELRPYHTNIIPGSAATGQGYLSFIMKELDEQQEKFVAIRSSSILKLTIYRSQEPEVEEIQPPDVVDELRIRITNVESLYQALLDLGIEDMDELFEKLTSTLHYGDTPPEDEQPENGLWMDTTNGQWQPH